MPQAASPIVARLRPAALLLFAIAAGLAVRYGLAGFWSKYGGVALWASAAYAGVLLIRPALSLARAAALALAISWGVELLQISPIPAYLSSKHIILRLIFGTSFSVRDLPAYAVGVLLAAALDAATRRG